jgi:hypothetical protein
MEPFTLPHRSSPEHEPGPGPRHPDFPPLSEAEPSRNAIARVVASRPRPLDPLEAAQVVPTPCGVVTGCYRRRG